MALAQLAGRLALLEGDDGAAGRWAAALGDLDRRVALLPGMDAGVAALAAIADLGTRLALLEGNDGAARWADAIADLNLRLSLVAEAVPQVAATVAPPIIWDTHNARISGTYPAANYAVNTLYFETDRGVFYRVLGYTVGSTTTYQWTYFPLLAMVGTSVSPDQRPTGLGQYDDGFLFRSSDALLVYAWKNSTSAWVLQSLYEPTIIDTAANLTLYPAARYAAGQQFLASDTLALSAVVAGSWVAVGGAGGSVRTATPGADYTLTGGPVGVVSISSLSVGTWLVSATCDLVMFGAGDYGQTLECSLFVGAAPQNGKAIFSAGADGAVTVTQQWKVTLASVATVTLYAQKTGGTGGSYLREANTILTATFIAP